MASKNKLPVMDIFGPTIQGEGYMCGQTTFFVRFVGCDYNCMRCDTMYAVDPEQYKGKFTHYNSFDLAYEIVHKMGDYSWVTFTGGNPALWPLEDVIDLLHTAGKYVAVETQGAAYSKWLAKCDVVTVSPKGPGMIADSAKVLADLENFMYRLDGDIKEIQTAAKNKPNDPVQVAQVAMKIPVFDWADMEFSKTVAMKFPDYPIWLSVGNYSYNGSDLDVLRHEILDHQLQIFDMLQAPELQPLHNVRLLPQLHVLLWGNAAGR